MKQRFIDLWDRLDAKGDAGAIFSILEGLYSQQKRQYHNLTHIDNCLRELDEIRPMLDDSDLFEFAIYFHDAVIVHGAEDNEEKSALLAYKVAKTAGLAEEKAAKIRELVLATNHRNPPETLEGKLMADIDLAILGKPHFEYDVYSGNIKEEYKSQKPQRFREGRKAFILAFLGKERIFQSDYFYNKYEAFAEANLRKELEELV